MKMKMKYIKKYNEELHFNPLQIGKVKVKLKGGSVIYVDKKLPFSKENCQIIADDCLKLIKKDLGDGWRLDDHYQYGDLYYFKFIKGNYIILISYKKDALLNNFNYQFIYYYFYKHLNIPQQEIEIDMGNFMLSTKFKNWMKKYSGLYFSLMDDVFRISNFGGFYIDEFVPLPIINESSLEKLIKDEIDKSLKKSDQKNKIDKDILKIKNFLPTLIDEVIDSLTDTKDFTSFSKETYIDPKINLNDFRRDYLKNKMNPIAKLNLHWEKLSDSVYFEAKNINDWDYLIDLSKKIKQLEFNINYLNSEYFSESYFKLYLRIDKRNDWEIQISINPINSDIDNLIFKQKSSYIKN